jgi:hypothetical protein
MFWDKACFFWYVTPRSLLISLLMLWRKVLPPSLVPKRKRSKNQAENRGFGLLFDPEDGGSIFL